MRKFLFVLLFGLGFMLSANAQTQAIKTNPLGLAFGNFNVTYEKVLNDKSSFLVSGSYWYSLFGVDVGLGGVGAGWRYFFTHKNKDVPAGFYLMPQANVGFGGDVLRIGVGAEIGYQWVWSSGFVLDLGIGPQYTYFNYNGDDDDLFDDDAGGILPSATLAIGYAW